MPRDEGAFHLFRLPLGILYRGGYNITIGAVHQDLPTAPYIIKHRRSRNDLDILTRAYD